MSPCGVSFWHSLNLRIFARWGLQENARRRALHFARIHKYSYNFILYQPYSSNFISIKYSLNSWCPLLPNLICMSSLVPGQSWTGAATCKAGVLFFWSVKSFQSVEAIADSMQIACWLLLLLLRSFLISSTRLERAPRCLTACFYRLRLAFSGQLADFRCQITKRQRCPKSGHNLTALARLAKVEQSSFWIGNQTRTIWC
jgi:hypothetical protein